MLGARDEEDQGDVEADEDAVLGVDGVDDAGEFVLKHVHECVEPPEQVPVELLAVPVSSDFLSWVRLRLI